MQRRTTSGPSADGTIELRPERQRGLASKIAGARAQRNEATLSREDFMEDPVVETPEIFEPSHQEFRSELRRIIADDAERAANESGAPAHEIAEEAMAPVRHHSRTKIATYWMGCFLGIGAVTYGLTRSS